MYAQIFFVTSLRGSGSVPTMLANCSEGCMGFIKALFFAFGVVFAIFAPSIGGKGAQLRHRNCNGSDWQTWGPKSEGYHTSPQHKCCCRRHSSHPSCREIWWTWSGSNRRPLPCHGSALPAAPQAHCWKNGGIELLQFSPTFPGESNSSRIMGV